MCEMVFSMSTKTVTIVIIGSEVLKGIVQDTNSHWIAKKLTRLGYKVRKIITVPDEEDEVIWALRVGLDSSDIVITTGGLGFTEDDKTISIVARVLGLNLVLNQEALEMIKRRVGGEVSYWVKAAYLPERAKPLYNPLGVAPGVYLKIDGKELFLLPGAPSEMTSIFENEVEPLLKKRLSQYSSTIVITTEYTFEYEVDALISQIRRNYPSAYFKTHTTIPVKLSIVVTAENSKELEDTINSILLDLSRVMKIRYIEKSS